MKTFHGRTPGLNTNGYPWLHWPSHTYAMANGMVYVHRAVAAEVFGELPDGWHVHHKDEDRTNFDADNLELLPGAVHHSLHRAGEPVWRRCATCGVELAITSTKRALQDKVYCSPACAAVGSHKATWPDRDTLRAMVEEHGYRGAGALLGVSDNAVRKHL